MNTEIEPAGYRPPTPILSYAVIAACVLVFFNQRDQSWLAWGALWPGEHFRLWQIVSYSFLHGDLTHLLFNMIGIHMFGADLERVLGTRRFGTLYFVSVITAALLQLAVLGLSDDPTPTVGASGGLFGLLLMYAALFPNRKLMLILLPIPLPAWLFVSLYAAVELWMGVTGTLSGIAHFAHLGGLIGGLLLWLIWRHSARRARH